MPPTEISSPKFGKAIVVVSIRMNDAAVFEKIALSHSWLGRSSINISKSRQGRQTIFFRP